jgi:glycosyltransferase involved in cell wall biosynthesis
MAAVVGGAPLVVSRRVAFPIGASPLSRWKYRRAAHFIAVSNFVKGVLMEAGVDDDRVTVVYDGVKLPRPTSSAGDSVITVASGDPMKGADLVREAARLGGFEIRESSDLEADLPGAALLVYISRSEGLGSAALLAMAHGVPVVASNVGGLREIVDDGTTGVLTANEPRSICAAIERALAERQTMGMNARRLVADRFTVGHMAEDTRRVYEKVLGC